MPSIKRILRTSELNCSICCQSAKPWCVTQQLAHKTLKAIFPQHFADDSTKIYCKADLMALLEHALPRPPFKCDDARALNLQLTDFVASGDDPDRAAIWPLVKTVRITGPFSPRLVVSQKRADIVFCCCRRYLRI